MRELSRVLRRIFNNCEPSHIRAVNGFTAIAQAFGYLAIVNKEERRRGVLRNSACQQRYLRPGAE
jgi:hypothetical protein